MSLALVVDTPEEKLGAHTILGILANQRKDFETARQQHHEQSLAIKQSLGLEPFVEKLNLGSVALDSGDPAAAVSLFEDVLDAHRRNGNPSGIGFATLNLGLAQYSLGDIAPAPRSPWRRPGNAFADVGFHIHVAHALQGLAACAAFYDQHLEAAYLLGQAAAELGEIFDSEEAFPLLAAEAEAAARLNLGDDQFAHEYEAGKRARE